MGKRRPQKVYVPGFWQRMLDRFRGEDVRVVEAGNLLPILVVRFPRSRKGSEAAESLTTAYRQLLTVIEPSPLAVYAEILPHLPRSVVVELRALDPGGCLGHARPQGMESEFARNLAKENGASVGEIDLSWELIARWKPRPLATMAVAPELLDAGDLMFRVGLLTVLFHELEHLAFPDRKEREVRERSDAFWEAVLRTSVREQGDEFGIAVAPNDRA